MDGVVTVLLKEELKSEEILTHLKELPVTSRFSVVRKSDLVLKCLYKWV